MKLLKLWSHDHPTCAAGCGTTWMHHQGEIQTELGTMQIYICNRGLCNMLTVVSRYTHEED